MSIFSKIKEICCYGNVANYMKHLYEVHNTIKPKSITKIAIDIVIGVAFVGVFVTALIIESPLLNLSLLPLVALNLIHHVILIRPHIVRRKAVKAMFEKKSVQIDGLNISNGQIVSEEEYKADKLLERLAGVGK